MAKGTIIIVEGSEDHRLAIRKRCEQYGFSVEDQPSIPSTVAFLNRSLQLCSAIITDVSRGEGESRILGICRMTKLLTRHPPMLIHSQYEKVSGVVFADFIPPLSSPEASLTFIRRPREFGDAAFLDPFLDELSGSLMSA